IELVATENATAGRFEQAADAWRRLTRFDPLNARVAVSYMEAVAGLGDRAAALAHGKAYTTLIRQELDSEADPEIERLMSRLRDVSGRAYPEDVSHADAPVSTTVSPIATEGRRASRPMRWAAIA